MNLASHHSQSPPTCSSSSVISPKPWPRRRPEEARSMAPPALMDEIVEEILLRIPPDDPVRLVRAALVCMAWCRLVSGPGFRRRYREFHRTAPMLGFFHNPSRMARFVPTSSFRPRHADRLNWVVMDVRHGRVLLRRPVGSGADPAVHLDFEVWDPITDELTALPRLLKGPSNLEFVWSAVVFCAASKSGTCDHLDCRGGPTLAVFVVSTVFNLGQISVRVYSSEDGSWTWSEPVHVVVHSLFSDSLIPSALGGNLLYLAFPSSNTILKYNLDTQEMSDIHRPPQCLLHARVALMTTEDGQLQLATVNDFRLYIWSREDGHEGDAGWAQNRVIQLQKLITASALTTSPVVVGAANGIAIVFLQTHDGLFTFDLKSGQATKVCVGDFSTGVLPYMGFYTPVFDLASKNEGPSGSASRA